MSARSAAERRAIAESAEPSPAPRRQRNRAASDAVRLEQELRDYLLSGGFGALCRSTCGPILDRARLFVRALRPCTDCGGRLDVEAMVCRHCRLRLGLELRSCPVCRRKLKPVGIERPGTGFVWASRRECAAAERAVALAAELGGVHGKALEADLEREGLSPLTASQVCPACLGSGWVECRPRRRALSARPTGSSLHCGGTQEPNEREVTALGHMSRLLRELHVRAGKRALDALCAAYGPEGGLTSMWHLTRAGRRLLARTPNPQHLPRPLLIASLRLQQEHQPTVERERQFKAVDARAAVLLRRVTAVWNSTVDAHQREDRRKRNGIGVCRRPL